jgi:hypothetical protein
MRLDPICALVVGIVVILLVVLSHRLCRSGKSTPAATKPPRATRDPKPFAGLTHTPDCPACEQEAGLQPSTLAPNAPPPRMTFTRGRRRHIDPTGYFCPHTTCSYHGREAGVTSAPIAIQTAERWVLDQAAWLPLATETPSRGWLLGDVGDVVQRVTDLGLGQKAWIPHYVQTAIRGPRDQYETEFDHVRRIKRERLDWLEICDDDGVGAIASMP